MFCCNFSGTFFFTIEFFWLWRALETEIIFLISNSVSVIGIILLILISVLGIGIDFFEFTFSFVIDFGFQWV